MCPELRSRILALTPDELNLHVRLLHYSIADRTFLTFCLACVSDLSTLSIFICFKLLLYLHQEYEVEEQRARDEEAREAAARAAAAAAGTAFQAAPPKAPEISAEDIVELTHSYGFSGANLFPC